jgi:hypothetical protein
VEIRRWLEEGFVRADVTYLRQDFLLLQRSPSRVHPPIRQQ